MIAPAVAGTNIPCRSALARDDGLKIATAGKPCHYGILSELKKACIRVASAFLPVNNSNVLTA